MLMITEMKKIFFCLICFFSLKIQAQKITYSEQQKKDNSNISFEVLGKFGTSYLIYKKITRQHYISQYNQEMKLVDNVHLDFLPERAFNIDFINYPDHFYMIYQYQRNNIVYCAAVNIGADGKKITEPNILDTTNIGFFADNKIYTTTFSEDKKKIFIYKRNVRNDFLTIATKLFDQNLILLDSTRQVVDYNRRKEIYSDFSVDNSGNYLFAKETKIRLDDKAETLEIYIHKPNVDSFYIFDLQLQGKLIEEPIIKIDNLNKKYIVNAFYFENRRDDIEGLYTAVVDDSKLKVNFAFNVFSESLKNTLNANEKYNFSFDNLTPKNIIVKRSGGFIIISEDFYTESLYSNNSWTRNNSFNNLSSSGDYYMYSPYYNSYRSSDNYNRDQSTRYYYNDIVIASVDSSLQLEWNSAIHKKQYDVENDNFLSYSLLNSGKEIHFLFIERNKQNEIVSNHSLFPDGEIKRNATLKSTAENYEFMPKLGKQVGSTQMIIPYLYLSRIGFAKIDF